MTIYLDVVLFENILMNILIIYTTNYINRSKLNLFKMFISAILGSVYYISLLLPQANFLNFYLYKIILSIIMVLISFGYKGLYNFAKTLGIFYFTSFIYGGLAYGIYNIFNTNNIEEYYSFKIIFLSCILGFLLIRKCIITVKNNAIYSNYDYDVDVFIGNKVKRLKGFLDTGNNVKDPISNSPVLVVCFDSIKDLLPKSIVNLIEYSDFDKISNDSKIRLLPYMSVGNQNGLMVAYKIDKIKIYINKQKEILINNVLIGINNTKLGRNNNFDALLSIELLNYERGNTKDEIAI